MKNVTDKLIDCPEQVTNFVEGELITGYGFVSGKKYIGLYAGIHPDLNELEVIIKTENGNMICVNPRRITKLEQILK